jgi:hypothetical protein
MIGRTDRYESKCDGAVATGLPAPPPRVCKCSAVSADKMPNCESEVLMVDSNLNRCRTERTCQNV